VFTANMGPNGEVAAYGALFAFYAAAVGIALFIYLFARDAKPGKDASA
jgi:hypothetical protein